jgi:hypothetical protein
MPTRRLLVLLVVLQWINIACQAQSPATPLARPKLKPQATSSMLPALPLAFEPNQGQVQGAAKFVSHAGGYDLRVLDSQLDVVFKHGASSSSTVTVGFVGAGGPQQISGSGLLPGKSNYYIGPQANWHTGVPEYKAVRAAEMYPGIDVVYYGNRRQLEFDFVVAPGAAADRIRLHLEGTTEVAKDHAGNVVTSAAENKVVFQRPVAYQDGPSGRQTVEASYEIHGSDVQIRLGSYDRSRQLTIDPVLSYAIFVGGSGLDTANAVATDAAGNAYLAGQTCSTSGLPNPTNTPNANCDAYVTAITADGTAALYTTYLGGANGDKAKAIAVDASGNVAVVGTTNSPDFPTLGTPYQSSYGGGDTDAFVSHLDTTGHLTYSTFLGGSQNEDGNGVTLDSTGNIIVVGQTGSTNFPTNGGPAFNSLYSGFVTELNASNGYSSVVFSRYFPISLPPSVPFSCDGLNAVALDPLGDIYVGGTTIPQCQVPTNRTAFQGKIAKATPFGGVYGWINQDKPSQGLSIAVDSLGNAVLVGDSQGGALVQKANPLGSDFVFSTVIGTSSNSSSSDVAVANAVAVDENGFIYVGGTTSLATFPLVSPTQPVLAGTEDAFVLKLDPSGTTQLFSTYFGGGGSDYGNGIALTSQGSSCGTAGASRCIYLAGTTYSPDMPVGAGTSTYAGNGDAFVAKWTGVNVPFASLSCSAPGCPVQINFGDQPVSSTSTAQVITLKNLGDAPLEIFGINASGEFAQTHTCGTYVQPGASCTINATFVPTAAGLQAGAITITDNSSSGTQVVSLSGNGTGASTGGGGSSGGGGSGSGGGSGTFAVAVSQSSATVNAGSSATFTLTVTPTGNLSSKLAFSCSGLPSGMPCTFSPATPSLSGPTPVSTTVSVGTQARASLNPGPFARPSFLAFGTMQLSLGLVGVVLAGSSKKSWRRMTFVTCGILLVIFAILLSGCGGGTTTGSGTQAGSYTMTITATATELSPPVSVTTAPVTIVVK